MVYTIFAHHKHLLECRAKQVARAVQLLDYCPTGALSAIEPMLQSCVDAKLRSASARGHYALALVLLSRLQLDETDLETLRKIVSILQVFRMVVCLRNSGYGDPPGIEQSPDFSSFSGGHSNRSVHSSFR